MSYHKKEDAGETDYNNTLYFDFTKVGKPRSCLSIQIHPRCKLSWIALNK